MKIHEYREMMRYLTRPDISNIPIPIPKTPAEQKELSNEEHAALLNAQTEQSYATGGRVGFKLGGDVQNWVKESYPEIKFNFEKHPNIGLGSLDENYSTIRSAISKKIKNPEYVKPSLDTYINKISDAFLKADAKDDISYLASKNKYNKNGMLSNSEVSFLSRKINSPTGVQELVDKTGLKADQILDMLDERQSFIELDLIPEMATTSKKLHSQSINKSIDQGEDWLIKNSKNYDSVKDLKKGFTRVFGQDNPLLRKSLRSSYGMPKLNPLFFEEKTKTYQSHGKPAFIYGEPEMKNLFEASLYNFNPTVRDKVLNELNDILPKEKITENKKYDLRKKFQDSEVLSEFGINKGLKGPVTRLLIKDLGDNIVNDINFIRYPRTEVGHYINYLKDKVDPKYKKQFNLVNDALNDIKKNNYNGAKNKLNIVENINFDHKVPKYLIDAGYADELEYIKLNPVGENFNQLVKRDSFDKPMARLSRKYENTNVPEEKAKIIEDMNNLKDNFNKRHNDYLSDINIKEVDGKLNISSAAKPMTSSDELIQTLEKNVKENPQFFKLEEANKLSRLSSFPAQAAESKLLSTLASKAGTVGSEFSSFAGGKGMAVLGAGLNYPEIREKGFGKAESLGLGAVKGLTQDTFNFIMDTLPMPSKYSARGAINDIAKEMEAKGESPYVEGIGGLKVLDVTKFDWNSFAEKHPGFFQFFNKAADYVSEKLPTKYKAENIIEHEIKKDPNAPFKSQYYDLYDPRSDKEKLSKEEEDAYKERVRKELFKQNPDVEKEYNKQSTNPVSTGPFYLGTETAQELKVGGRVGYADGSDDELEIPTLSSKETPMSGIYSAKRLGPEDPISKYQSYSELELLGNISAKKPNYQIEEENMLDVMPIYEPRDTIPKGSRPVMPNIYYDQRPSDGILKLSKGGIVWKK